MFPYRCALGSPLGRALCRVLGSGSMTTTLGTPPDATSAATSARCKRMRAAGDRYLQRILGVALATQRDVAAVKAAQVAMQSDLAKTQHDVEDMKSTQGTMADAQGAIMEISVGVRHSALRALYILTSCCVFARLLCIAACAAFTAATSRCVAKATPRIR